MSATAKAIQQLTTTQDLLHLHEKAASILRLRKHCLDNKADIDYNRLTDTYHNIMQQILLITLKF